MEIDWVEVSRVAHQLGLDHGFRAHVYAEKLAKDAERALQAEDAQFWTAVAAQLRPRGEGNDADQGGLGEGLPTQDEGGGRPP